MVGRASDVPWAMVFPGAGETPRHPSQLYEAFLEGIVLFIILRIATHRYHALTRPGTVFGLFLVFYGLFRSLTEFVREPHRRPSARYRHPHAGHRLFHPHDPDRSVADLAGAAEAGPGRAVMGALSNAHAVGPRSLAARLRDRIAGEGSISVHDYMDACLGDRRSGYYTTREPIGAAGDFITAPEISQIFGELIGVWCIAVWQAMGAPSPAIVAELGPGRGTLMADALRAWRSAPEFLASVSVALIETSPALEVVQRETLSSSPAPLQWYAALEDVPPGPLILIANEFIDALPVRQFVRQGGEWRERTVTITETGALGFGAGGPR